MHPLEERSNMNGTFTGRIVLVEGDEVDVDLHIAAEEIRLGTPFAEIGLWDRDSIQFERNAAGGFELTIANDVVTFYPTDQAGFAAAIAGNGTVAQAGLPGNEVNLDVVGDIAEFGESDFSAEALTPHDEGFASSSDLIDEAYESSAVSEEPPVSAFGRSSRERLASAMSDFRDRQEDLDLDSASAVETETEENSGESAPIDQAVESTAPANGFLIPGDEGYVFPDDGVIDGDTADDEPELEEITVADEILASQRSLRGASKMSKMSLDSYKLKRIAVGVGILAVLVGIGFSVPIVLDFFSTPDDAQATVTPTTAAVTASTAAVETTVVTESPPPSAGESAFDLGSPAFVERWNDFAAQVSPSLRFRSSLPAGDFEVGFTPFIAMLGVSDSISAESTLESFTIEVDPTGPSASDRLGIQALGLAIAVADPSLEPNQRGALLGEMGLNVRDPSLAGLDGSTTRNGIGYQLFYDAEAVMLRLEVKPQN